MRRLNFWLFLFLPNEKASAIAITFIFFSLIAYNIHYIALKFWKTSNSSKSIFPDYEISCWAKMCG